MPYVIDIFAQILRRHFLLIIVSRCHSFSRHVTMSLTPLIDAIFIIRTSPILLTGQRATALIAAARADLRHTLCHAGQYADDE